MIELAADDEQALVMWTDLFARIEGGVTGNAHDIFHEISRSHGDKSVTEMDKLVATANDLVDSVIEGDLEGKY